MKHAYSWEPWQLQANVGGDVLKDQYGTSRMQWHCFPCVLLYVFRITNIDVHPCDLNWAAMQLKIIAGCDHTMCIIVEQCCYCSHFKHSNVLIYITCRFNGHKEINTQFFRYCDCGTNTNIAIELWQLNVNTMMFSRLGFFERNITFHI